MNKDQPARPANIENIVAINQGRRPLTMGSPQARSLSPEEFAELAEDGHLVVDARSAAAFGSGHVPGALSILQSSPEFEQRIGWVTPADVPILLVTDDAEATSRALYAMAFLGLDARVEGHLAGGMRSWLRAGRPQETLQQISVHELATALSNGSGMQVLDVREISEWDTGHVAGAHYMNFKFLADQIDDLDLACGDRLSVLCAAGARSSIACSVLLRYGFRRVRNVTGGMGAWAAAGLPVVDDAGEPL
jgi:hydroxyacylglutathione hydrolase